MDVREIQATGKVFVFKRDQMAGTDSFADYIKFPNKERQETGTYRIKPTEIFNGDSGWSVYDKKIEALPAAEIKESCVACRDLPRPEPPLLDARAVKWAPIHTPGPG